MPHHPHIGRLIAVLAAVAAAFAGLLLAGPGAAAATAVQVTMTTTSDGRTVVRGLQEQAPAAFEAGNGSEGTVITVDPAARYQPFEGGGASFTDSAAWLMNSSGALSAATRDATMRKLFSPTEGIGLGFLRNPMGASDIARSHYTYDDTCCDLSDFSISRDLADVLPMTQRARQLNPDLKVMAVPWSAPAWMKDNGRLTQMGKLRPEYYDTYAQYFVKYLQAYEQRGVHVDYVSVQNEPQCCGANSDYPTMEWSAATLLDFTRNHLFPAFRSAGITTRALVHDWNHGDWNTTGAGQLADAALRGDPLFGGVAWHGYTPTPPDYALGSTVQSQYPGVAQYETEHSGGTWVGDQQLEDLRDITGFTRNWARAYVKWSLALDQARGPHAGGCDSCSGLVTVHNGDARSGQVDYTVEYYTMGQLTKFVRAGAVRIGSNATDPVWNTAFVNSDGQRVLVTHNSSSSTQQVTVREAGQHFTYSLPARATTTFTWSGAPTGGGGGDGDGISASAWYQVAGAGSGKCVDAKDRGTADGTAVQQWSCVAGQANQQWQFRPTDGGYYRVVNRNATATEQVWDVTGGASATGDSVPLQTWRWSSGANQQWKPVLQADGSYVLTARHSGKCLDVASASAADGALLQQYTCNGTAAQSFRLTPSG
ncbi:RICIN domain-containing protein [Actinacidiphila glaucinigra]|uniref:RICIN domain-containing protein n=1 Tax=Actinacidiphila glaucinigra TaxID=235986 RepID=UPI003D90E937